MPGDINWSSVILEGSGSATNVRTPVIHVPKRRRKPSVVARLISDQSQIHHYYGLSETSTSTLGWNTLPPTNVNPVSALGKDAVTVNNDDPITVDSTDSGSMGVAYSNTDDDLTFNLSGIYFRWMIIRS